MSGSASSAQLEVPFVDLARSHAPIRAELVAALEELLDTGAFVNGPAVGSFERAFAAYCCTTEAVGLASGLDGLRLALLAAGISRGDEVVVPAHTFVATLEAVTQAGGTLVLADVGELDYNLDPSAAAAAVSERTAFLLPVHLYGQMADMRAFEAMADRHGLGVIEDACQAHGAERDGFRAGASGLAGAFSFYPAKNLGAMGDAGALTTDDAELAERVRALREHGQRVKYRHDVEGYTARLDTMQAIVLELKLRLLDGWNEERRAAARYLHEALAGVGDLTLPAVVPGSEPVWHLFVVRTAAPETLARFLRERGIATGRHYPEPVHLAPAYAHLGHRPGAFSVAERVAAEGLSLPMFPGITEPELAAIADSVRAYFDHGG